MLSWLFFSCIVIHTTFLHKRGPCNITLNNFQSHYRLLLVFRVFSSILFFRCFYSELVASVQIYGSDLWFRGKHWIDRVARVFSDLRFRSMVQRKTLTIHNWSCIFRSMVQIYGSEDKTEYKELIASFQIYSPYLWFRGKHWRYRAGRV